MARGRATITVDRDKLAEARALLGVQSASAPPTAEEAVLALSSPDWDDLVDNVDWDALPPSVASAPR